MKKIVILLIVIGFGIFFYGCLLQASGMDDQMGKIIAGLIITLLSATVYWFLPRKKDIS